MPTRVPTAVAGSGVAVTGVGGEDGQTRALSTAGVQQGMTCQLPHEVESHERGRPAGQAPRLAQERMKTQVPLPKVLFFEVG